VKILPKDAPTPVAKPEPAPKREAEPIAKRPERPKELSYDDALAKLRGELGDDANSPLAEPLARAATPAVTAAPSAGQPSAGVMVSPEVAAWNLAVMRHIRSVWITPPEFRESGLAAQLEIDVSIDGQVLGTPELVRSSGNPAYDDNAIRAVVRASPLPPAPSAGRRTLIFTSEE
jgi:TonB family protein